jgi:hypothetical protein
VFDEYSGARDGRKCTVEGGRHPRTGGMGYPFELVAEETVERSLDPRDLSVR